MNEHTLKQFDTEMEAIRSGVLAMGGLVERQLTHAIAILADEEDAEAPSLPEAVGAAIDELEQDGLDVAVVGVRPHGSSSNGGSSSRVLRAAFVALRAESG